MLYFRDHQWTVVPVKTLFRCTIPSEARSPDEVHWRLSLHYVAGGPQWRRVHSHHRPMVFLDVFSFRPDIPTWQQLETVQFWKLPPDDDSTPATGTFEVEYSNGPDDEDDGSFNEDHMWRIAGRNGRYFTVELAAFEDGRSLLKEQKSAAVLSDGTDETPDTDSEFWKANAQIYLIEHVPFGLVTVWVPRNAPDPEAAAIHRARALLGTGQPEHIDVHDFANSEKAGDAIKRDIQVRLHFHGYYEN
jgi:hypothetical protein